MSENQVVAARAPSAAGARQQLGQFVELWLDAMFLQSKAYAYERDQKNPFGNGLLYVALVGVIVALAGILGAGLRYVTRPSPDAIKNTVQVHLEAMPFFTEAGPAFQDMFQQYYNGIWDLFGSLFVGYPTDTGTFTAVAITILTTPLGLIIGWVLYGALVHLVARGWNPETSLPELLAPLALATSPQLLNVLGVFPAVSVSGVVIALWSLICSIFAIRIAYQTTSRRAVWGAVFPLLVFALLALVSIVLAVWAWGVGRGG